MVKQTIAVGLGLSLAVLSGSAKATELALSEICADGADWVDDNPVEIAREFEEAFREFDWRFTAFSGRLSESFGAADAAPDAASRAGLRTAMSDVYRALAQLIPMRSAGNEAWPMKFLLEEIPAGIPLPDFDPSDREEMLRAAFLRELATVSLPGPERSKVRFLARLDMTYALLNADAASETDLETLRVLAGGALAEAYDADFREPALRVLDNGWHTSLASRFRRQVTQMCAETAY